MILLKNKITLGAYLVIAGYFLSLNISCTEKIAGSEVTNEDAVCLVGKVLDQRGQGVSNIIARLDKIQLADTTDNNGNYSLSLSKQEISDLKINLDTLNDTVKIISSGTVASSIGITKWIDTLPSVYLIQRNIYGKLETDGTGLKRIEAIIAVLDTNNNVIEEFSKNYGLTQAQVDSVDLVTFLRTPGVRNTVCTLEYLTRILFTLGKVRQSILMI